MGGGRPAPARRRAAGVSAILPVLAVVLALAGYAPYIAAVLRGRTRPNRASWWIFALSAGAGTASSWAAGARVTVGVPATFAVCCVAVGLLAIRRGEGGLGRLDLSCLAVAAAALLAWWATGEPLLATAMLALADLAGTLPTVAKAWRDPAREHGGSWIVWMCANLCNLAQVRAPDPAELLYPGALTLAAAAVLTARYRHLLRRRSGPAAARGG